MPDKDDGRHAIGNKPGTKAQQQRGHRDADPRDNKTAKDTGHEGKHRKD
jgi:hypothetical protein